MTNTDTPLARLERAKAALAPAEPRLAVAELAACLTLVAPSGMSADDRTEWIKVARATIGDVPASALQSACAAARKCCRFASEIVPVIIEEAEQPTRWLRDTVRSLQYQVDNPPRPSLPPPPTDDKPLTATELVEMTPYLRSVARRQEWVGADVWAEVDSILEAQQEAQQ